MATYEVTSPDGRTFEVTAPEGASQDDVLRYAQQNFESIQKQPKSRVLDVIKQGLNLGGSRSIDRQGMIERGNQAAYDEKTAQQMAGNDQPVIPGSTEPPKLNVATGRYEVPGRVQDAALDVQSALRGIGQSTQASVEGLAANNASDIINAEANRAQREAALRKPNEVSGVVKKYGLGLDSTDIESAGHSMPFSFLSMGTGLAGRGLGHVLGTPLGPIGQKAGREVGGALGSGVAAYRMDRAQVWNQLYEPFKAEFVKQEGREPTPEEFTRFTEQPKIAEQVQKHALAEAGFEAAGQALFSKTVGAQVGKALLGGASIRKIMPGLVKAYLIDTAGELATETPTQIAQNQAETALGLQNGPAMQWNSADDWRKAFSEVFWPTVLTTTAMGGAAAGVSKVGQPLANALMASKVNDFVAKGGYAMANDEQLDQLYAHAKTLADSRPNDGRLADSAKRIQDEIFARVKAGTYRKEAPQDPATGDPAVDNAINADSVFGAPTAQPATPEIPAAPTILDGNSTVAANPAKPPPPMIMGKQDAVKTERGDEIAFNWALVPIDQENRSHDADLRVNPDYPAQFQPRDRTREASQVQAASMEQNYDPSRAGWSPDIQNGAPYMDANGVVLSGNQRGVVQERILRKGGEKADALRNHWINTAEQYGFTPTEMAQALQQNPMLALRRVLTTAVNPAEFARQANSATVAQMSPSEQSRSDAARITYLDDLSPTESGDFSSSHQFIQRFVGALPQNEQGGMMDANGQLSQTGYARIRNAVLAKAYGDSPALLRMVESLDDNLRNISKALMQVAPKVAKARDGVAQGALYPLDITQYLLPAVEKLSRLRDRGVSVSQALSQMGMFGGSLRQESRQLLAFLDENIRRPRKIADFISAYLDALEAAGNPNQGSLLSSQVPTSQDLLNAARRESDEPAIPTNTLPGASLSRGPTAGDQQAAPAGESQPNDQERGSAGPGESGRVGTNPKNVYRAYPLTQADREMLLRKFPPTHPRVIADHISAEALDHMDKVVEGPARGEVIGIADADGIQSLIVSINGRENTSNGSPFHITWSTNPGIKSGGTGEVVRKRGYTKLDRPIPIDLSAGPTYSAPLRPMKTAEQKEALVIPGGTPLNDLVIGNNAPPKDKPVVVVFGGSFNPIHAAHAAIPIVAKKLLERAGYNVEKVIVSPSPNVLINRKAGAEAQTLADRGAMALKAIGNLPGFEVNLEPSRIADRNARLTGERPNRTAQADWAQEKYPGATIVNIAGEDTAPSDAPSNLPDPFLYTPSSGKMSGRSYLILPREQGDSGISSSRVRKLVNEDQDVPATLMPAEALRYYLALKGRSNEFGIDGGLYNKDVPNFGYDAPPLTLKDDDPLLENTWDKNRVVFDGEDMPREKMRGILVDDAFKGVTPAPEGRKPVAYLMGGGSATGKGTIKRTLQEDGIIPAKNIIDADSDDIKFKIPEMDQIITAGDSRAADVVHKESSEIFKAISERATNGRYDIILDVTLRTPKVGARVISDLKAKGYEVRLFGATVDPEIAVIRSLNRARANGRYIPPVVVLGSGKGFMSGFETFAKMVDSAALYDMKDGLNQIVLAKDGVLALDDSNRDSYNNVVERGKQTNEQATTLRQIRSSGIQEARPGLDVDLGSLGRSEIQVSPEAGGADVGRGREGEGGTGSSVQRTLRGAPEDGGVAQAKSLIDEGLAEIGAWVRQNTPGTSMLTAEEKAQILPALSKVMLGLMKIGITNFKEVVREAKSKMKEAFPKLWNKILPEDYAAAARTAVEQFESGSTNEEQQNDNPSQDGGTSPQGPGADAVPPVVRKRKAPVVRNGQSGFDFGSNLQPNVATSESPGPGAGTGPDQAGGNTPGGGQRSPGGSTGNHVGLPAGRDIPVKTGRNYAFSDSDLTYEGGWLKKATQNVDAIELALALEKEGRQATREEQATLAKFIGWGASEIANGIFGADLNTKLQAIRNWDDVSNAVADAGGSLSRWSSEYRMAQILLRNEDSFRYGDPVTPALLAKVKPKDYGSTKAWLGLRDRLKAALSEEEWDTASRSTQNAHYTSKAIVQSLWKAVDKLGFKGGTILEPGAGIGVFPGLMPAATAVNSSYTGIEFDHLTGAILKQLFPDERILVESYVDSTLPDNFYDVAIGNPPFAPTKILADAKYRKHAFALHDYFFAKTIDKIKPGGLMVFVSSRFTMDKKDDKARAYLAERADLIGAIRLPQTAFQKNAGTEVVTDVLFLRKHDKAGTASAHAQSWAKVSEVKTPEGPYLINEYFAAHPEMVLGSHSGKGSMYGKNEYTVIPKEGDIEAQFAAAVENLPANVFTPAQDSAALAAKVRDLDFNPKAQKEGNYYLSDAGVVMQRENGMGVRVQAKEENLEILKSYISLRDALKQAQYDQLNDGPWEKSLAALGKAYKAFVAKHGRINQATPYMQRVKATDEETGESYWDQEKRWRYPLASIIKDDTDYTLALALETFNEETGEITEAPVLSTRVLAKRQAPQIVSAMDAMLATMNELGKVDIPVIAARIGVSEQQAIDALGSMIYEDPSAGWQTRDEYLSGNVRKKLQEAEAAAKSDRRFERNIPALIEAQPTWRSREDINLHIGQNWIPPEMYSQFLKELVGAKVEVTYNQKLGAWDVVQVHGLNTMEATTDWGTREMNAADILEAALSAAPIRVMVKSGHGKDAKMEFSPALTEAAKEKLQKMREAFTTWAWQDQKRADFLVKTYNEKMNTIVPRVFDGSHLTLPGVKTGYDLFDHVKRGAWRIIQTGNTYLAHAVGSGKTNQMIISAMEQKRLGLINKPMMVVPNHMLQQFTREWLDLYPAARLMVADETQFTGDNRRRFISRVALSDLDGVIITHSSFGLLDLDPEFKQRIINQELDVMRAVLEEAGGNANEDARRYDKNGKWIKSRDPKIKRIEQAIESLEQKLEAAMDSSGKDKNVRFDEMGVDMVYVDEAHQFRKLAFATNQQIKGIDTSGSKRAFDLYMKTRWLEEKHPGRSLVMASGTPVTNTLAELYTVQKFMAPQILEERGISNFNAWSAMFGRETSSLEPTPSGGYEMVTRFARFENVPELVQMFREFADVLTSDDLASLLGDKRPKVENGSRQLVLAPKTEEYRAYQQVLAQRMTDSKNWKGPDINPDPIIRIIGDGRLAAIDMRFIDPKLPSNPNSKFNRMIDGIIATYKETADWEYNGKDGKVEPNKGATQIVFADLGLGEGAAKNRGFNARAWMEKRLRDAGVNPAHVAFMSDYKRSIAKANLFKDVNAGKVRILVGTTLSMGTGVNAQQRLIAEHHLDAPWFPADLEQREGRIIRTGNKNKNVRIFAYSTKGTYDEQMWGLLRRKQAFIDQAMSGDDSVRSVEDLSEASLLEQLMGMVAEDPRVMELAGLNAEVERYVRMKNAHSYALSQMANDYQNAGFTIEFNERRLPAADKFAAMVEDLSGDKFKATVGSESFDKRKDWGAAILAAMKDKADRMTDGAVELGKVSGFPIVFAGRVSGDRYEARLAIQQGDDYHLLSQSPTDDPVGLAMRVANVLGSISRLPGEIRTRIQEANAKRNALAGRLSAPFEFEESLQDAIYRADKLKYEISHGRKELTFDADEWANPTTMLSRGREPSVAPASVTRQDAERTLGNILATFKGSRFVNADRVHLVNAFAELPAEVQADARDQGGNERNVYGVIDRDNHVWVVLGNHASLAHVEETLFHELRGHLGTRAFLGNKLVQGMNNIFTALGGWGGLKALAEKHGAGDIIEDYRRAMFAKDGKSKAWETDVKIAVLTDEVLARIAGKQRGTMARIKEWLGQFRQWLRDHGFAALPTFTDADVHWFLRQSLDGLVRGELNGGARYVSMSLLSEDFAQQEKWMEERAKSAGYADVEQLLEKDYPAFERLAEQWRNQHPVEGAMLSRGPIRNSQTANERADAIIGKRVATFRPLDATLRVASNLTGISKVTEWTGGKIGQLIDRLTPESVKAGVVSDYGVPEAVIDARALLSASQRKLIRTTGTLIDKLSTLTRAESRVAYEWMNSQDPQSAEYFRQQLPAESIAVLADVEKMIDQMSQEAVRLGQLDPESFKRNRFAYLHRTYQKHMAELTQSENKTRTRAISILGDQYKGRGMVAEAAFGQIKNIAPEWWNRKTQNGKADAKLVGEKFVRLERRAPTGEGVAPLEEIQGPGQKPTTPKGRLLEVVYWPAGEAVPARYGSWDRAGTWEGRTTKGDKLIVWRDFTKEERVKMGEVDEVRYAIAKTLHGMIHDVEVGKYLEWLARSYATKPGEAAPGPVVEATESMLTGFAPGTWVQVPETKVPGTNAKKYGALAGRYLPGPIWNDVRQTVGFRFKPLGEVYAKILSWWKTSKTALSPAVHTNNIMANFVMADWNDVSAGHVWKALRILLAANAGEGKGALGGLGNVAGKAGISDTEAAKEVLARFEDSGGSIGTWATNELRDEQIAPLVEAMEHELTKAGTSNPSVQIGVYAALQHILHLRAPEAWAAIKGSKPAKMTAQEAKSMLALYENEDQVFRLAAWLKTKEEGASDTDAGKVARKSFLDYHITAPWIQMARQTGLPFISFVYRAAPMMLSNLQHKPWKLAKLAMMAGAVNALGYLASGGDEDDERRLLPEEKAGRVWGVAPKLIRMPWNDANGSPVFLDIRRWVPVGDLLDTGQNHSAIPLLPALVPGGPLAMLFEFINNKTQFTAKPITLETDTATEKAAKTLDWLWKSFAPNIAILPGTYAWTGISNAASGKTDAFGREQSTTQAIASAFGVKVGAYPRDVLMRNITIDTKMKANEIDRGIHSLGRELAQRGISQADYEDKLQVQVQKKIDLYRDLSRRIGAGGEEP